MIRSVSEVRRQEGEGGGEKNDGETMPIIRGSTSRGAHVRAIYEALMCLIDEIPEVPSARRVKLRTCVAALVRAYPGELGLTPSDVAQEVAEMDGDGHEDF